ncbi:3-oxoacyl-[acyl-carrier-protein] reductase FabG [Botrimarina colliarenosi]|uniref:3-oxoacyl-[acyl-carrier-protein] reductase FabG n=2 Tax=Botrimarina colliarenosi TaxID=2528001 RepID=A0A5C6AP44_9BACT|nr:3-oxoacyl-[acyl-carrier-protein] reductase FabG [Botrimarina colliarenosi]
MVYTNAMLADPLPPTLARQVALVTGGARRVGKAIAIELARRGARVAIHANSSIDEANELGALLQERYGTDVGAFQAELTDEGVAEDLVHRVARHFACTGDACDEHAGALDILINCAAIWPETPFEDFGAEDVRKCLDVNTVAPLLLAKHAGLWMAGQESGGVIINLGDAATGPDGKPYRDYPAYHPSKAAIPGMTRMLAVELSRRNKRVRVNAVLPGPVICQHLPGEPEEPEERKDHARYQAMIRTDDLGGYGKAEHVAHAVAMLVENPFMTGVVLPVDGGGRLR